MLSTKPSFLQASQNRPEMAGAARPRSLRSMFGRNRQMNTGMNPGMGNMMGAAMGLGSQMGMGMTPPMWQQPQMNQNPQELGLFNRYARMNQNPNRRY